MIDAASLERRMAGIEPIGLTERGTTRLAWTPEAAAADRWFNDQAETVGLRTRRDPAGNLWACPDAPPPWWATGSHLDTVRDGGRFDGALGVAAAFEVAARSDRPIAVISFADEEGARFNTPTFGSRALVGRLDASDVLGRRDDDGIVLADAMAAAGLDPRAIHTAPEWANRLRGFLELHIDQTREVAAAGSPLGVVRTLAARARVAVDVRGAADHAGTTHGSARRDALAAAARLIVAALDSAERTSGVVATCGRLLVEPNALTTVARRVRLWLDARAADADAITTWRTELGQITDQIAAATRVGIGLIDQSHTAATVFDAAVGHALMTTAVGAARPVPELVCFAGHDAGVLAERLPTGMVLVRNEQGISHAPEESVDLADAAVAAQGLLEAIRALA